MKDREGRREEGSEWSGDWDRRGKESHLVNRCDRAEVSSGGEAGKADGEGGTVFGNCEADGGDREHVMKQFDWGSTEGAANVMNCIILGYL